MIGHRPKHPRACATHHLRAHNIQHVASTRCVVTLFRCFFLFFSLHRLTIARWLTVHCQPILSAAAILVVIASNDLTRYCMCVCFFCYDFVNSAGGSSVALTVISPVYGSSNGSGVPTHYNSPYAMPSLHPSSSPSGSQAPPPPPPPPIMTTTPTSRGLHHQPSMRGGITSPQPVGVFTHIAITFDLSLLFVSFLSASCSLFSFR
jgi:hypothetical protein